jgi:hypothetical protein
MTRQLVPPGRTHQSSTRHTRRTPFLGRRTRDEAERHYQRYIGPYFTRDCQVDLNVVQQAVDAVAAELGVASVSADRIYQPAL